MLDARNLWELVEARAEATPISGCWSTRRAHRSPSASTATRPSGPPPASPHGGGGRRRGVLAAPHLDRVRRPRGALSRLGRCRTRSCRSTGSARSATSPGGRRQALHRPVDLARLRLRGDGPGPHRGERRRPGGADVGQGAPRGRRVGAPAGPRGRRTTSPVRWLFSTSGTTADPKGARHTDKTIDGHRAGHVGAARLRRRGPERSRLPVHPHRRHHVAVLQPADRRGQHPDGGVRPERDARGVPPRGG